MNFLDVGHAALLPISAVNGRVAPLANKTPIASTLDWRTVIRMKEPNSLSGVRNGGGWTQRLENSCKRGAEMAWQMPKHTIVQLQAR